MNAKLTKSYAVLAAALVVACGEVKQPAPGPGPTTPPVDPHRDQVNAYLDSLPVGDPPRPRNVETLSSELDRLDDASGPKACASESRHITEDFDEVALLATANANIVPGLAIQAKTVTDGTIQPVPLARGPMTYVIDLPLADTHVEVDSVSLDSAQQAVSTVQLRAADVDAPARLSFTAETANSLEQAAHNLGVGAQFSLGLVNAGFGVSFGGSHSLSFRTIVAKLIQPMYTVSVADDKITPTADFFAENVGIDDVKAIEAQGLIGPDNQPTFIKSVTYGRVLYYSVSTEDAADNEELTAAVNASYRGFGGNVDAKNSYDRIMSRAIVEVLALGGSQDDALAAIRSADFSLFFKPVKVAQAIPISYKLNYMQG